MEFDSKRFIQQTKSELLRRFDVTKAFNKSRDMMLSEIEAIRAKHDSGLPVIPQVEYHDIVTGTVEEPFRDSKEHLVCLGPLNNRDDNVILLLRVPWLNLERDSSTE